MRLKVTAKRSVSRALRGYTDVSPATRARVREVARSLGYTPDAAGQALKSGRAGTVAVLVSGSHGPALLDAFYAEVLGGRRGASRGERPEPATGAGRKCGRGAAAFAAWAL